MNIKVGNESWAVELPKGVTVGYYGIANFKCLTDDKNFQCTWKVTSNERQAVRQAILNYNKDI